MYDLQIFSSILHRLPFHFVDGFLCWAEAFQPLVYFVFVPLLLVSNQKKIITRPMSWSLPYYVFFEELYDFRSYIQVFNPFCVNFYVQYQKVFQIHSFAGNCQVSPTLFFKRLSFPQCIVFIIDSSLVIKLIDHICMGLFLGYLFH